MEFGGRKQMYGWLVLAVQFFTTGVVIDTTHPTPAPTGHNTGTVDEIENVIAQCSQADRLAGAGVS